MQSEISLKREFFKKWLIGLQKCSPSKEKMPILERKKAIKLSADLAMASTRNSSWSNALISKATKDPKTGSLAKRILGHSGQPDSSSREHHATIRSELRRGGVRKVGIVQSNKKIKKKKIISTRIRNVKKSNYKVTRARAIAKRLVKKRTEILKGLVPGGESMDEYSLIKEALDYILSLRAQVDVMHHLTNSPLLFNHI